MRSVFHSILTACGLALAASGCGGAPDAGTQRAATATKAQPLTVADVAAFGELASSPTAALAEAALVQAAPAGDWGDLKVQFVFDGDPPASQPVAAAANVMFCSDNKELKTENLVVDPKSKAIRYVVAFMSQKKDEKQPPIHEEYEKTKAAEVVLDNNGCRFEPHIVLFRPTQTLIAANADPIGHNTNIQPINPQNTAKNFNLPPNSKEPYKFNVEETLPVSVVCNVHGWMKSYVVVKNHPYMGVSDAEGKLTIPNVPAGEWTFRFWHEESGYVRDVAFGKAKSDNKGLVKLKIATGENDLGVAKVPAALFQKRK